MADRDREELVQSIADRLGRVSKAPDVAGKEQSAAGPLLSSVNALQDRMGKLEEAIQRTERPAAGAVLGFNPRTGGVRGELNAPGAQALAPGSALPAMASMSAAPSETFQGWPGAARGVKDAQLTFNQATAGLSGSRDVPAPFKASAAAPMPLPAQGNPFYGPSPADRGPDAPPQRHTFSPDTGGLSNSYGAAPGPSGGPAAAFVSQGNSGTSGGRIPSGLGSNPAMAKMLQQAGAMGGAGSPAGGSGGGVQEMLSRGTSGTGGLGDREVLERLLQALEENTQALKQSKEGQGQQQRPGPQPGGGFVPGGPGAMAGKAEFGTVESGGFPSLRTGIPSPGMAAVARSRPAGGA